MKSFINKHIVFFTFLTGIVFGITFPSCQKEQVTPDKPITHKYEYVVYGTSGSYDIELMQWADGNTPAQMVQYYDNPGNSFSVRWTYIGDDDKLLYLKAQSNNPFGYVTVTINKDGNTVLSETATGMEVAEISIEY